MIATSEEGSCIVGSPNIDIINGDSRQLSYQDVECTTWPFQSFDVLIQNFFLNFTWVILAFSRLNNSVIVLPRSHVGFCFIGWGLSILSFAFFNFLASVPC